MKYYLCCSMILFSLLANAASVKKEMNQAFQSLLKLVPFLTDESKFVARKNSVKIGENLRELESALKKIKHEDKLKADVFFPSMQLLDKNLKDANLAFSLGQKRYAYEKMRTLTAGCIDCHTRLPDSETSSYQEGLNQIEISKFEDSYNLGIGQMIVRQYVDAKNSFTRVLDDRILSKQFQDLLPPLRQILTIELKVKQDPVNMLAIVDHYKKIQGLRVDDKELLKHWESRLKFWAREKHFTGGQGLEDEKDVKKIITEKLEPLLEKPIKGDGEVDYLISAGLLSQYSFKNPESKMAPEILYWLGMIDKYLSEKGYFSTGAYLFKECVFRYPASEVARGCLQNYKDSLLKFSTKGAKLEKEIQAELRELEERIEKKK